MSSSKSNLKKNFIQSSNFILAFPDYHLRMFSLSFQDFFKAKIDLNKKRLPKQKTIQNYNIDVQGFRKTRNENPPTRVISVTS